MVVPIEIYDLLQNIFEQYNFPLNTNKLTKNKLDYLKKFKVHALNFFGNKNCAEIWGRG